MELRWAAARPVVAAAAAAAVLAIAVLAAGCRAPAQPPTQLATFNIRLFPENDEQVDAAFELIAELRVGVVAVQEIRDPQLLAREAAKRLGPQWRAVAQTSGGPGDMRVGLLYDGWRYRLLEVVEHDTSDLARKSRPVLELALRDRMSARRLRLFVVHLKAFEDGLELRRQQLERLGEIVAAAPDRDDELVVLGDFNSVTPEDNRLLEAFAATQRLHWLTRELPCTHFWDRSKDELSSCPTSTLDHVFAGTPAREVAARGACERLGCEFGDRCPVDVDRLSDHCPVTVSF